NWYSIPLNWIYLEYNEHSYATFTLKGQNDNLSIVFETLIPMQFNLKLSFTDKNNNPHTLEADFVSRKPPNFSVPTGFTTTLGLGSMYCSYTDMQLNMSVNGSDKVIGNAWIDHQTLSTLLP